MPARLDIAAASGGPSRRNDLDWLRVIAFAVLIYFHTAILFQPSGIPNILNPEASPALGIFVTFSHQFRLALLFLVSGMGVRFALQHKSGAAYLAERSRRLLIPLLFGIAVITPPMIFFEKRYNGAFQGDFLDFYPAFFTSGVYPDGHLSWHHFWFIAYLYLFCLITWPLFRHWLGAGAIKLEGIADWLAHGGRLYWIAALLLIVELPLRPIFPGFRDLISDWASFAHWLIVFTVGFIMAHQPRLIDRCRDLRWLSFIIGVLASVLLFHLYYDEAAMGFVLATEPTIRNALLYIVFSILRMIAVWAWLMTCVGFAARHLNRPTRTLTYLNGAIYPLFCLHLTVIVALAYVILPTGLSTMAKFLLITTGTFAICLALYEGVIRRVRWIGPLFGARSAPSRARLI